MELADKINNFAYEIATQLLGKPDFKTGDGLRFSNGSLHVSTRGPHKGKWRDFKNDDRGDMLDLIQRQCRLEFKSACAWARNWLNEDDRPAPAPSDDKAKNNAEHEAQQRRKRQWALKRFDEAAPIEGTLGEQYLRDARAINWRGEWPTDMRFHPALRHNGEVFPGIVTAWRNPFDNEVISIHRTFLERDGSRALMKASLGSNKGGVLKLSDDAEVTTRLAVCEGVEDAMTLIAEGLGPAWAMGDAGHLAAFPVLPGIELLEIYADADEAGAKAGRSCANRWLKAGVETEIWLPSGNAKDVNDIARAAA